MPSPADLFSSFCNQLIPLLESIHVSSQPKFVVACSGGVDSVVLLHLTVQYCRSQGFRCIAAHVNHKVRDTSDRDERLVERMTKDLGIPFASVSLQPEAVLNYESRGQEADLRRLRYEALLRVAQESHADAIFVAHHGDDQLETVLWRLLRGTSPTGLGGMRAVTFRQNIPIVRPLLSFSKQDLVIYAQRQHLEFAVDETNFSMKHTRNVLRHKVVPPLKQLNSGILATTYNLCKIMQEEDDWLEKQAQQAANRIASVEPKGVSIDISQLHNFPLPLQRRIIKILLYCLASEEWTFQHVADILRLTTSHSPSAYIELPHGLVVRRLYGNIRMESHSPLSREHFQCDGEKSCVTWGLQHNSHRIFSGNGNYRWQLSCRKWSVNEAGTVSDLFFGVFPFLESLQIRAVLPGDRILPLGMRGSKKLQDVFVDAKVPRHLRPSWPILCAGDTVVWVPGLIRSREFLLSKDETAGWGIRTEPVFSLADEGFPRHKGHGR